MDSMNTLKDGAQRRTKEDVDRIRLILLDFDDDGTAAVEALLRRDDLPQPNYLLNSSPFSLDSGSCSLAGLARQEASQCTKLIAMTGATEPEEL